jgi:hypothetical protein
MASYFTDEEEGTRELINDCMKGLDESVKLEYLVNCLVLKYRYNMTVKEIFCAELIAKEDFEAGLGE